MESGSARKISYRPDIDGLRAIAVLSVMAFHIAPVRVKGGFVGVDIFFVISGFLISSIVYKELESGAFSILEFYVRRIRRIYPALFLVLCFVCVAGWIFLLPSDFVALSKEILGGSAFVANFVLWSQSGYFSSDAALKPLLHLWSLGVEEQYYLIFPAICMALYRSRWRYALPVTFFAIAAASMFMNVASVSRYRDAAYFLPYSRLWELFVGAGLSLCMQQTLQPGWAGGVSRILHHVAGLLGLALLLVSVFCIDRQDAFPGWWALLPTTGTALVIVAGTTSWVNRYILSCKPAVFVGLISYPLYLWHWPILSFMTIVTSSPWGVPVSRTHKTVVIVLAFLLAWMTYRFIELPIRQIKQETQRRKGALRLLGCVSVTGAFGYLVILMSGFPSRVPASIAALDHDFAHDGSNSWRSGTCFLNPEQNPDSFAGDCVDKPEGEASAPMVFVWGDSHAADLMPGFRSLQRHSAVRLAQFTASLCAPIVGLQVRERPACLSINNLVMSRIRILRPDVVVLSAFWDNPDPDHNRAERAQKLLDTIKLIKVSGVPRVDVLGSSPVWRIPLPTLLIRDLRRDPNIPVSRRLTRGLLDVHDDSVLEATALKADARYVPILENLCDRNTCLATTGPGWEDLIMYDQSHFTNHGSALLAPRIWHDIIE